MWRTAERRFVRHVCLRNPCLYWSLGLHSLPEAWGPRERQHTLPALHYACKRFHPFVAAAGKTCLMRRSRGFGNGVVVTKICYNAVIVLSVVLCDCCKPMNTCPDWAFSNSGLQVGLKLKLEVPESGRTLDQFCIMVAKDPIPSLQLREKPVLCREA